MQQQIATTVQNVRSKPSGNRLAPLMRGGVPTGQHVLPFFRDKTGFLQSVARECGPVGRIRMGSMTFHVVSAPEWIKYVYENPEIYNKDSEAFRKWQPGSGRDCPRIRAAKAGAAIGASHSLSSESDRSASSCLRSTPHLPTT